MSKEKPCPMYPVEGLIISGDPTPTAAVPGRGESKATVTQSSLVETPGQTKLRATGVQHAGRKPGMSKPPSRLPTTTVKAGSSSSSCKEVPLNFAPSTSKSALARSDIRSANPPVSGVNPVLLVQKGTANAGSGSPKAPLPKSSGAANKDSGSQLTLPSTSKGTANLVSGPPTGHDKPKKHVSNARRAFLQRRAAEKRLEQLGKRPAESLTPDEISSLNWARSLLAASKVQPSSVPKHGPKRQRSEEESALINQQPGTKRPKPPTTLMNRSFSEIAKGHLVRAVIDRGDSDGAIPPERWDVVRKKLVGVFWKVLKEHPGTPPECDDAGYFQNRIKLMACYDERSANLLKMAVQLIEGIWDGARLDVVPLEEIPRRPRSTALVPDELSDPEEILELLQFGNPRLPTSDWRVAKVSEPEGSFRRITVILNQASLAPLRETRGKVFYGFGTILLHVYRGDGKDDRVQGGGEPTPVNADDETADPSPNLDPQMEVDSIADVDEDVDQAVDEEALLNPGLDDDSDLSDLNVTVIPFLDNGEDYSN